MILLNDLNGKGGCILFADYRAFLFNCEGIPLDKVGQIFYSLSRHRLWVEVGGLIHTQRPSPWEGEVCQAAPGLLLDRRALEGVSFHLLDKGFDIITDQVECLPVTLIGRVDRHFRGWQSEDQPPIAHIHMGQAKHVAEENPVSLRIFAKNEGVCTGNHILPYYQTSIG